MKAIGKYKFLVFAALATMLLQVGAALWQPQYMKNILSVMAESISLWGISFTHRRRRIDWFYS